MARAATVVLANGATLHYRATVLSGGSYVGTGGFTRIPSVKSVTLPTSDREEIDTSDLDSEGIYKEFDLGDADPGESKIMYHLNPSNAVHQALDAASVTQDAAVFEFKLLLAHGTSAGYYKKWRARFKKPETDDIERNKPLAQTMNLRNSGGVDPWTNV